MIGLKAFGALELVQTAVWFVVLVVALAVARKFNKRDGVEEYKQARSERRAVLRAQGVTGAALVAAMRHDDPFPQEWTERLADTGELRELAETGDIDALNGHVAAFFRNLDLHGWTRKRGAHAA